MKDSTKKALIIEIVMLLVIISNFFIPYLFKDYKYLIFLLLSGIGIYATIGIDIQKSPKEKTVLKSMIIYLMIYFFLVYLLGLYIGFNRTIYSYTLSNLIKNILPTITIIVVSETLRYQLIKKTNNNKLIIVLSFILFLLLDACIGFYNYNLNIQQELYEYIGIVILGGISKNILMTVLDIKVDYVTAIIYRIIMEIYIYLVPIVPALGPYINSIVVIVLPIILTFMVLNTLKRRKLEKPNRKKKFNFIYFIIILILLVLILLNSGFFKYQNLVIGSNSMQPFMSKGDVVLIEKLKGKELEQLKKGDILVFRYDNKIITHRIYKKIEKPDGNYFITKGDNNNQADDTVIGKDRIIGIVRYRIEKVGLPSIWLNELFSRGD